MKKAAMRAAFFAGNGSSAASMLAATAVAAAGWFAQDHFVDAGIEGLLDLIYNDRKLTGRQTAFTGGAGCVGLLEPAQRLTDGGPAVGAFKGNDFFVEHGCSLDWAVA